jgi:hypothetical protein
MNRPLYSLLTLSGLLLAAGCGVRNDTLLRGSLDEVTLTVIKPNEQAMPQFNFHSKLPDLYTWKWGTNAFGGDLIKTLSINAAFAGDLREYVKARFPKTAENKNAPLQVDVELSSARTSLVPAGYGTTMTLRVNVQKDGSSSEPKVVQTSNEAEELDKAVEGNINKSIVLLDKYLSSLGL